MLVPALLGGARYAMAPLLIDGPFDALNYFRCLRRATLGLAYSHSEGPRQRRQQGGAGEGREERHDLGPQCKIIVIIISSEKRTLLVVLLS
jgi:hypothetical protein